MTEAERLVPVSTGPGEGERIWFLGTLGTITVPGEATGGRFALIEFLLPRLASPPLHTHPQDETFFVLDGNLLFLAGDRTFQLEPGSTATAPGGVPHSFRVDTETARVLVLSTPAGIERFTRACSVPATAATLPPPGTPRPAGAELEEIFAVHGMVVVGPSLAPAD